MQISYQASDAGVLAELVVPDDQNLAKEMARQKLRDDAILRYGEVIKMSSKAIKFSSSKNSFIAQ